MMTLSNYNYRVIALKPSGNFYQIQVEQNEWEELDKTVITLVLGNYNEEQIGEVLIDNLKTVKYPPKQRKVIYKLNSTQPVNQLASDIAGVEIRGQALIVSSNNINTLYKCNQTKFSPLSITEIISMIWLANRKGGKELCKKS